MEEKLIQIFKALSDETRLRIINLLNKDDLCVCELEIILELSQSSTSRHLSKLTTAGLLRYYKSAKYIYYTINDEVVEKHSFIKQILNTETAQLEKCQKDNERLSNYKEKGYTCSDLKEGKVCFKA